MKRAPVPCGLLVTGLLAGFSSVPGNAARVQSDRPEQGARALAHEGQAVSGLRLEAAARFVPEVDGWGSPKLEATVTFHNETDAPVLLDGYSLYYRLVLSRVAPLDAVQAGHFEPGPYCPRGPEPADVIRIPPRGKHVVKNWQWCEALSIPLGASVRGKVEESKETQTFKLLRTGPLTLAFMYRSGGPYSGAVTKLLRPGEQLWSGRVYSDPVTIGVSKLHRLKPVPAGHTGSWIDSYPSGKKQKVATYKDGKLDGPLIVYGPSGTKQYEEHYRAGLRHGLYVVYDREGRREFRQTYREGKCTGPMTWWYPNGRKSGEEEVLDGIRHGRAVSWHENGRKQAEGLYRNGKRHGRWTEWDESGKILSEKVY
jgi:antitoxin component YwqK of YwqJK toxin-antitoxin module